MSKSALRICHEFTKIENK